MPLYVSDYLADTMHLSTAEHGAYMLLLMHAWMNEGNLPTDDNRLRRICRLDEKLWKESKDEIKSFFVEIDGQLRHPRVDKELVRAKQLVSQRSEAGKASAAKRKAEREAQRNGNEKATSVATDDEREAQRNGKPSPPPSQLTPSTQPSSLTQPVDVTTFCPAETDIPDPPTAETHWLTWFNREASTSFDPGSRFDRKDLWPIFRRWCDAGITQRQMLDAIRTAQSNAREPIANLPKYIDRVLANSQAPKRTNPAEQSKLAAARAIFGTEIEGENHGQNDRVIDAEHVAIALRG